MWIKTGAQMVVFRRPRLVVVHPHQHAVRLPLPHLVIVHPHQHTARLLHLRLGCLDAAPNPLLDLDLNRLAELASTSPKPEHA